MNKNDCFFLGNLIKTHGYKGEFYLTYDIQFAKYLKKLESVFIEIDGILVPFFISHLNVSSGNTAIIKFEELNEDESAKEFIGDNVYFSKIIVEKNKNIPASNGVIDYMIYDNNLGMIGIVKEIIEVPENPLLKVINDNREILIPLNNKIIKKINKKEKKIYVELPDGLIELND